MKKRIRIAVIVLAALTCGIAIYFYCHFMSPAADREVSVYVPSGAGYDTLRDSLAANGGIKNMARFDRTARMMRLPEDVKPGRYVLKKGTNYMDAVRTFKRGLQTPVRLTFNNIRNLPQLAGRVAGQIEPDSLTMAAVLTDDTTAFHYGFARETFMAMFIPDTYEFYWNASPTAFLDRMHKEYERFWNDDRVAKLALTGLTRTEAVTLASIVYEETKMSDEMAAVAGVYMNRIKAGMPLQADPTVKFAVGDFALRRMLKAHLETDSAYNTYKYAGLPPGPISMPSVRAIDAVLNYQKHNYIYFCARPDFSGYHNFAVTLSEHNRNAAAYHRALNANGIR